MPGDFGEPVGLHKQIYTQTRPEHFFINNIFTLVAILVEFPLFAFSPRAFENIIVFVVVFLTSLCAARMSLTWCPSRRVTCHSITRLCCLGQRRSGWPDWLARTDWGAWFPRGQRRHGRCRTASKHFCMRLTRSLQISFSSVSQLFCKVDLHTYMISKIANLIS